MREKRIIILSVVIITVILILLNLFHPKSRTVRYAESKNSINQPNIPVITGTKLASYSAEAILTNIIVITQTPTPTPTFTPTPTPTKTPTPVPVPRFSGSDVDGMFHKYSQHFSVSEDMLRKIAYCESGYNSSSINGIYGGMYQFSRESWIVTRHRMGADPNPDLRFHAEEAIKTAAFKISIGGAGSWPNCSR